MIEKFSAVYNHQDQSNVPCELQNKDLNCSVLSMKKEGQVILVMIATIFRKVKR
jgi:hypothetical protein